MGLSKIRGTPKSSILMRVFRYFHHPFWGPTPILGNTHLLVIKFKTGSHKSIMDVPGTKNDDWRFPARRSVEGNDLYGQAMNEDR